MPSAHRRAGADLTQPEHSTGFCFCDAPSERSCRGARRSAT